MSDLNTTKDIDLVKIVDEVWKENELHSGTYKVAALTAMQKLQELYETKAGYDTDKIQIGRKLSECTTDDASGSKLNMPLVSKAKRSVCGCYQPNIDNTTIPPNRK